MRSSHTPQKGELAAGQTSRELSHNADQVTDQSHAQQVAGATQTVDTAFATIDATGHTADSTQSHAQQLDRKAGAHSTILMVCTVVSRILGLVRTMVVSWAFGASGVADVINFTFNIPNNLRKLLAEGALSSAFLPVLAGSLDTNHGITGRSRRILQGVLGFQLIILLPLVVLAVIFSPVLMRLLSQFQGEQLALATTLFRYFILYLLIISIAAILGGALQSVHTFIPPGVSPILFSLSVITGILVAHQVAGPYSMVVGVLVGGMAQLIFLALFALQRGYSLRPIVDWKDSDFQRIIGRWTPVVSSSLVFIVSQQISFSLATPLAEGSVSALSYAIVFWQLPYGVFASSITTVFFPKMSREWVKGDNSIYHTLLEGLQRLSLFIIPASILLYAGSEEFLTIVLERGEFTRANTLLTASVLRLYALGILGIAIYTLLLRFYYAKDDYLKPLVVSIIVALADLLLSLWLRSTPLAVGGLALAHAIAFSGGSVILILDATKGNRWVLLRYLRYVGLVLVGNIPMVVLIGLYRFYTPIWWIDGSLWVRLGLLTAVGVLFIGTLVGTYRIFRIYRKAKADHRIE